VKSDKWIIEVPIEVPGSGGKCQVAVDQTHRGKPMVYLCRNGCIGHYAGDESSLGIHSFFERIPEETIVIIARAVSGNQEAENTVEINGYKYAIIKDGQGELAIYQCMHVEIGKRFFHCQNDQDVQTRTSLAQMIQDGQTVIIGRDVSQVL